jgi:hypothetical protein
LLIQQKDLRELSFKIGFTLRSHSLVLTTGSLCALTVGLSFLPFPLFIQITSCLKVDFNV